MKKSISIVLISILFVCVLTACGTTVSKTEPEHSIPAFETSAQKEVKEPTPEPTAVPSQDVPDEDYGIMTLPMEEADTETEEHLTCDDAGVIKERTVLSGIEMIQIAGEEYWISDAFEAYSIDNGIDQMAMNIEDYDDSAYYLRDYLSKINYKIDRVSHEITRLD